MTLMEVPFSNYFVRTSNANKKRKNLLNLFNLLNFFEIFCFDFASGRVVNVLTK